MQCKVMWIFRIVVNWQNSQARKLEMKNNLSTLTLHTKISGSVDKVGLNSVTFFKAHVKATKLSLVRKVETL